MTISAAYGLLLGSFATACIYRWPREESVLHYSRSFCPHCRSLIRWYDNVPVLSWLFLLGRCRSCRASISIHYPLVELVTAAAFALAARYYDGWAALGACAFLWAMIVSFMVDIEHRIIPNEITYTFTAAGLLLAPVPAFAGPPSPFPLDRILLESLSLSGGGMPAAYVRTIAGFLVGAGIIAIIRMLGAWFYGQEAMGMGDVKLMGVVGAWLGTGAAFHAFFNAAILGGIWSIGLLVLKRAGRRSYMPFGPWLAAGAGMALFNKNLMAYFMRLQSW